MFVGDCPPLPTSPTQCAPSDCAIDNDADQRPLRTFGIIGFGATHECVGKFEVLGARFYFVRIDCRFGGIDCHDAGGCQSGLCADVVLDFQLPSQSRSANRIWQTCD